MAGRIDRELNERAEVYNVRHTRRKRWRQVVSVLCAVVVFVTIYALILPAITMNKTTYCGIEEHVHDANCYEKVLICGYPDGGGSDEGHSPEGGEQIAGLSVVAGTEDETEIQNTNYRHNIEENSGTQYIKENSETQSHTEEEILAHVHTAECYELRLNCGKEEHIHSEPCYVSPDADKGTAPTDSGADSAPEGKELSENPYVDAEGNPGGYVIVETYDPAFSDFEDAENSADDSQGSVLRSARAPRRAAGQTNSEITYHEIMWLDQLKFGDDYWNVPYFTIDDDGGGHLTPPSAQNKHNGRDVYARIYFTTNGGENAYQPGELEVRLPAHIFKDRDGNFVDTFIPPTDMASNGLDCRWETDPVTGEETVVIYNTRIFDAASQVTIVFNYQINDTVAVIANEAYTAPLSATISGRGDGVTTDEIKTQVHTHTELQSVTKTANTRFDTWPSGAGDYPDDGTDQDDYFYIMWTGYFSVKSSSTQPYSLTINDLIVSTPGEVVKTMVGTARTNSYAFPGIVQENRNGVPDSLPCDFAMGSTITANAGAFDGSALETPEGPSAHYYQRGSGYTARESLTFSILTRHKKSDYTIGDEIKNEFKVTHTSLDDQVETTMSAEAVYTYEDISFSAPPGNYGLFKNTIGSSMLQGAIDFLKDNREVNVFNTDTAEGSTFQYYVADNGNGAFKNKISATGYELTYDSAYGGKDDISAYGHKKYTMELIDDRHFLNPGLKTEDQLTGDDYELQYVILHDFTPYQMVVQHTANGSSYELGYDYDADKMEPVKLYVRISDGDWHEYGTVTWDNYFLRSRRLSSANEGTADFFYPLSFSNPSLLTVYDSGSQYAYPIPLIKLPANCTAVKAVTQTGEAKLEFAMSVIPKLKSSERVLRLLKDSTGEWLTESKLVNINTAVVRDAAGKIVNGGDITATGIDPLKSDIQNDDIETYGMTLDHKVAELKLGNPSVSSGMDKKKGVGNIGNTFAKDSNGKDLAGVFVNEGERYYEVPYYVDLYKQIQLSGGDLDIDTAIELGIFTPEKSGVFWDLLPKGAYIKPGYFGVRTMDGSPRTVSTSRYTYRVGMPIHETSTPKGTVITKDNYTLTEYPNWQGSGRTMVKVEINAPDSAADYYKDGNIYRSGFTLIYNVVIPFDAVKDFGMEKNNYIAYETGAARLESSSDKVSFSSSYGVNDYFSHLQNSEKITKYKYAYDTMQLILTTAAVTGLSKNILTGNTPTYTYGHEDDPMDTTKDIVTAETNAGETYQYRLRLSTNATTKQKDIVFYDVLEQFGEGDIAEIAPKVLNSERFYGTLTDIDLTQLRSKNIAPVLYYSEQVVAINDTTKVLPDIPGGENTIWKPLVIGTTDASKVPTDLSKVKTIAIDCRKTIGGDDYILPEDSSISVNLIMRAPELYAKSHYAYNQVWADSSQGTGNAFETASKLIRDPYTAVKLNHVKVRSDLTLLKADKADSTKTLEGVSFRLVPDDTTEAERVVTTGEDGKATFKDLVEGGYTLKEITTIDGYSLLNEEVHFTLRPVGSAGDYEFILDGNPSSAFFRLEKNAQDEWIITVKNEPNVPLDVDKVDDGDPAKHVPGAKLKITRVGWLQPDGSYSPVEETEIVPEWTTDGSTKTFDAIFEKKAVYRLTETHVPDTGYLPAEDIYFAIDADGKARQVTLTPPDPDNVTVLTVTTDLNGDAASGVNESGETVSLSVDTVYEFGTTYEKFLVKANAQGLVQGENFMNYRRYDLQLIDGETLRTHQQNGDFTYLQQNTKYEITFPELPAGQNVLTLTSDSTGKISNSAITSAMGNLAYLYRGTDVTKLYAFQVNSPLKFENLYGNNGQLMTSFHGQAGARYIAADRYSQTDEMTVRTDLAGVAHGLQPLSTYQVTLSGGTVTNVAAKDAEDTEGTEDTEGSESTEGTEDAESAEDTEGTEATDDTKVSAVSIRDGRIRLTMVDPLIPDVEKPVSFKKLVDDESLDKYKEGTYLDSFSFTLQLISVSEGEGEDKVVTDRTDSGIKSTVWTASADPGMIRFLPYAGDENGNGRYLHYTAEDIGKTYTYHVTEDALSTDAAKNDPAATLAKDESMFIVHDTVSYQTGEGLVITRTILKRAPDGTEEAVEEGSDGSGETDESGAPIGGTPYPYFNNLERQSLAIFKYTIGDTRNTASEAERDFEIYIVLRNGSGADAAILTDEQLAQIKTEKTIYVHGERQMIEYELVKGTEPVTVRANAAADSEGSATTTTKTLAAGEYLLARPAAEPSSDSEALKLKNRESITLSKLQQGWTYEVYEKDYSQDSYITTYANTSGSILRAGEDQGHAAYLYNAQNGFRIRKRDPDIVGSAGILTDAKFTLYRVTDSEAGEREKIQDITLGDDGTAQITLPASFDQYLKNQNDKLILQLEETQAPSGYDLPKNPWIITIRRLEPDTSDPGQVVRDGQWSFEVTDPDGETVPDSILDNLISFDLDNNRYPEIEIKKINSRIPVIYQEIERDVTYKSILSELSPTDEEEAARVLKAKNPRFEGWYEHDGETGEYFRTADTRWVEGKGYYEEENIHYYRKLPITDENDGAVNPSENGWYIKSSSGGFMHAHDIIQIAGSTYYEEIEAAYGTGTTMIIDDGDTPGMKDMTFTLYRAISAEEAQDNEDAGKLIIEGEKAGEIVNLPMADDFVWAVIAVDESGAAFENRKTDEDGRLSLGTLAFGEYWLVETDVPIGYVKPQPTKITVSADGVKYENAAQTNGLEQEADGFKLDADGKKTYEILFTNTSTRYVLPESGGIGTLPYTMAGLLLLLTVSSAGCLLYIKSRRKEVSERE